MNEKQKSFFILFRNASLLDSNKRCQQVGRVIAQQDSIIYCRVHDNELEKQ
jgi:hypothetical protein